MKTVYLAGPEVFLPYNLAVKVFKEKKDICKKYNLEGVLPVDISSMDFKNTSGSQQAIIISAANEQIIRNCDCLVANLTPFRGVSADAGTVYELGFAKALGKFVAGYTNSHTAYFDRVEKDAYSIENFGLFDNLMLYGALRQNLVEKSRNCSLENLDAFEECIKIVQ